MQLEKATTDNIAELQEICIAAYAQNFAHHWEENGLEVYLADQFSTERLAADVNNPNFAYYFIKTSAKPIGFIKIKWTAELATFETEETVELEKIYVLPEMKGQGIGKKALTAIIQEMKNAGKKIFFLCVIDTNTVAIKFYEKLGFQFHSKTRLEAPFFKEALKGMHRMYRPL